MLGGSGGGREPFLIAAEFDEEEVEEERNEKVEAEVKPVVEGRCLLAGLERIVM